MRNQPIPIDHHIARFVAYKRTRRDEVTDEPIGILSAGLQLRDDEEFLSVNWVEFHEGELIQRILLTTRDMGKVQNLGPKGVIAWANVGLFKSVCSSYDCRVRVIHEADLTDNPAHSGVRRLKRDNADLLNALAEDAFTNFVIAGPVKLLLSCKALES